MKICNDLTKLFHLENDGIFNPVKVYREFYGVDIDTKYIKLLNKIERTVEFSQIIKYYKSFNMEKDKKYSDDYLKKVSFRLSKRSSTKTVNNDFSTNYSSAASSFASTKKLRLKCPKELSIILRKLSNGIPEKSKKRSISIIGPRDQEFMEKDERLKYNPSRIMEKLSKENTFFHSPPDSLKMKLEETKEKVFKLKDPPLEKEYLNLKEEFMTKSSKVLYSKIRKSRNKDIERINNNSNISKLSSSGLMKCLSAKSIFLPKIEVL